MTGQAATMMAALRRARMVLLSLALMAGILGMHVVAFTPMSGHGAASDPAGSGSVASHGTVHTVVTVEDAAQSGHSEPGTAPGHDHGAAREPGYRVDESCTGGHGCATMHTMDASCTPAAKTATLEAPPPGTGFAVVNSAAGAPFTTAALSHRPLSPSPGDLCISRT